MDYNAILQWYYYSQTGTWATYGNSTEDTWLLQIDTQGNYSYEKWNGSIPAPNLQDADIFNSTNESIALAAVETHWQQSKNIILKMIENNYVEFLKYDWSTTLQEHGIVPPGYEITVENTDEPTNMYYLLVLKKYDEEQYEKISNEFLKYKATITDAGGIMDKVISHPEIEESSSSSYSESSSSSV